MIAMVAALSIGMVVVAKNVTPTARGIPGRYGTIQSDAVTRQLERHVALARGLAIETRIVHGVELWGVGYTPASDANHYRVYKAYFSGGSWVTETVKDPGNPARVLDFKFGNASTTPSHSWLKGYEVTSFNVDGFTGSHQWISFDQWGRPFRDQNGTTTLVNDSWVVVKRGWDQTGSRRIYVRGHELGQSYIDDTP